MNETPATQEELLPQSYSLDISGMAHALYERLFGGDYEAFLDSLITFWNVFSVLAVLFSLVLFFGYIYAKLRSDQLGAFIDQQLRDSEIAWAHTYGNADRGNSRWGDILSHVAGQNPSEWRVAIIEADVLLDEVLENAGYTGVSIADRLKSAENRPFDALQDAWSAHKVRNQIAHPSDDFVLTKKIAQETITRYERVFREFGIV